MDAAGQAGEAYSRPWTGLLTPSFGGPSGFKAGANHGVYWSGGSFRNSKPQCAKRGDADCHAAVWYESYVPRVVSGMVSSACSKQPPALAPCSCPSESFISAAANVISTDGNVAATVYGSSRCLHVKLRRLDLLRRYFISLDLEVEGEDIRDDVDHYLITEPNHLDGFQWFQFEFTINVASVFRRTHGRPENSYYRLTMRVVELTGDCWPAGAEPVVLCLKEGNCGDLCHPQSPIQAHPWAPEILCRGPEGLKNFAQEINSFAFRTSLSATASDLRLSPGPSHGKMQNGSSWDDIGYGRPQVAVASCLPNVCYCCSPYGHCDCDFGDLHRRSSRTTFFRDLDSEVELALKKMQLREWNDLRDGPFDVPRHWENPHEFHHDDPSMDRRDSL
ncbi:uncharacterized protein LOC144179181 [Haemaphysalis longicornis]